LADDIEGQYGTRPDLIKGRGGVFEVTLGDELIYSKKATGRFPEPGEVEALLAGKLDAA
jgi:selenoprotein W-related protein